MSYPRSPIETPDSWIERQEVFGEQEPEDPNESNETGDGYPEDWPRCAAGCGRPALDGHMTCGLACCNEGSFR